MDSGAGRGLASWRADMEDSGQLSLLSLKWAEATLTFDKIPEFLKAVVLVNTLTNTCTSELVNASLSV